MLEQRAVTPRLATTSLERETVIEELAVDGAIPTWIDGTLIRNGPARFEAGEHEVRHWFDGLAMLHAFRLRQGRVAYANRFLRTKAFEASSQGRIGYREFATDPCRSFFRRMASLFSPGISDNAFINVVRSGEEFIAMSETPIPVVFDPRTLETLGVADPPPGHMPTAHPHRDPVSGDLINFAVHLGPRSSYRLFVRRPNGAQRTVSSIPVREPAYLHSFAMTERFLVLAFGPLVVNPLHLALGGRPFIENYRWEPERGSEFVAVDRGTGAVIDRWSAAPLFVFHHINAYEAGNEIVVDLCAYDDPGLIEDLYLERLRESGDVAAAQPRRYRLPLGGGWADWESLAEVEVELPRVNPGSNGRPYSLAWGTSRHDGGFANALVQLEIEARSARLWHESECHPGEPVFIPRPGGTAEDDGVLLSVVLDAAAGRSFLLVLDAATLAEIARAGLPHHIPLGIHGQFYDDLM